ncbi:hypothetical protein BH11MYX1_BH11MYX1_41600 [soil metagenome]
MRVALGPTAIFAFDLTANGIELACSAAKIVLH